MKTSIKNKKRSDSPIVLKVNEVLKALGGKNLSKILSLSIVSRKPSKNNSFM
jgi:hypothetical protein